MDVLLQGRITVEPSRHTFDSGECVSMVVRVKSEEDPFLAVCWLYGEAEREHAMSLGVGDVVAIAGDATPRARIKDDKKDIWMEVNGYALMSLYAVSKKRDLIIGDSEYRGITH